VDFSPDGRLLVSSSYDGVRLWDMDRFAEVGYLPVKPAASVIFHPDGNSLFTYGPTGLQRWPIRREVEHAAPPGETEVLQIGPPQTLEVPGNWVYAGMSLDHQGHRLTAVDFPHSRAFVLDLDDSSRNLVLEDRDIAGCFLSPDGKWAVTHEVAPTFKVWSTLDGKPVAWSPPVGERHIGFTADARWLVSKPPGQMHFHFWQIGTWQLEPNPPHTSKLVAFSASPDGTLFLWADSVALPLKLISLRAEKVIATLEPAHDVGSVGWRFSPDGEKLVVGSGNHTMHVWDLREIRRELAELGLDWDQSSFPPKVQQTARPIRVEMSAAAPMP
jgi:WD40 repeat protein